MWSFLSRLTGLESTSPGARALADRRPPVRLEAPTTLSRRTLLAAAAAAAVVGAIAAARLLAPDRRSEEDRIRALFDDAARAAEEKRVADAVEGLSERFRGGGLDRRGAKQLVAYQVLRGDWVSVSVAGARVRVEGARARAVVDAVLARGAARGKSLAALLPGEASAHRFECDLEREAEGWRIVEARWRALDLAEALAGPPEPDGPPAASPR